MTRAISQKQFVDLWWEEFCPDKSMTGCCMLCGNKGRIDTRGKVFNARGKDCGGEAWCICPNGRAIKRAVAKAQREDEA